MSRVHIELLDKAPEKYPAGVDATPEAAERRRKRLAEAGSLTDLVECSEEMILARQFDDVTCALLGSLAGDGTRDARVRSAALSLLGVFGERAQQQHLVVYAVLVDSREDWRLRRVAAWACGRMPESYPQLSAIGGLEQPDARTWEALALWVAGPRAESYAGALRLRLKEGGRDLAIAAGEALIRLSESNLSRVRSTLRSRGFDSSSSGG